MINVVEQLTPNPVTHEHGENGCCKNHREWEMEMMHQVWAAGLHDAANCFQNALKAKWKLESQGKVKPKTNADRIREMTVEELAQKASSMTFCSACPVSNCDTFLDMDQCRDAWLAWFRSPVEESHE